MRRLTKPSTGTLGDRLCGAGAELHGRKHRQIHAAAGKPGSRWAAGQLRSYMIGPIARAAL